MKSSSIRVHAELAHLNLSSDSTGLLSEHGTLLAQARTRPFDAVPRNEYIATRVSLPFCFP